ncbi:MAG: GNAT family N-acetyltransferase [Magnetococcus sp. YQC-5]
MSFDTNNSSQINFQKLQPEDDKLVNNFMLTLSRQSLYYRFISCRKLTAQFIKDIFYTDLDLMEHRKAVILTGCILTPHHDKKIIAMGGYYPEKNNYEAEVALVVGDLWQGRKIGTFLFNTLASLAQYSDISRFTALVCTENIAMQKFLKNIDFPMLRHLDAGLYDYEIELLKQYYNKSEGKT